MNREIQDVVELYHYTSLDDLVHQATRVMSQQRRHLASKRTYPSGPKTTPPSLGSTSKSSNIKYFKCLGKWHIAFQCPNKKNMVMREDGNVESESSCEESSSNSEVESSSDSFHNKGDSLMVRRLTNAKVNEDNDSKGRTYFTLGEALLHIIDGGSCVNVASLRLVKKLNLPTLVHPRPYKLQWLSGKGEIVVDKGKV
ncbi:hypothetical protein CR513_60563, partial [Mucuna pruriens]